MEFSEVNAICELATLRTFYHNVADYECPPDPLFSYGWGKVGYKKMWLEYSGIVDIGVDANEIVIKKPDLNGVVEVYVPEARVLNVSADKDTISTPYVETGEFTSITSEDQAQAFSQAQIDMNNEVEQSAELLNRGRERAKKLLEEYIVNTGKQLGKEYSVKWIDDEVKETEK